MKDFMAGMVLGGIVMLFIIAHNYDKEPVIKSPMEIENCIFYLNAEDSIIRIRIIKDTTIQLN